MTPVAQKLKEIFSKSLWAFAYLGLGMRNLSRIHQNICKVLESPSKRKLIVVPRGFFKTSLASVAYPLWLACHNPQIKILLVAKSQVNASKRIRVIRTRGIEQNALLTALYPHLLPKRLNKTRWSDLATCINRPQEELEATFESAGVGTALPSRHYNVIICDDIIAPDVDAMTEDTVLPNPEEIQKTIGWHKMLDTLLVAPANQQIIVHIATRWDRRDVVNHILENEGDYYEKLICGATDKDGEPIFPELFPLEVLQGIKKRLGSYMYSLQYDNQPLPVEGYMLQPGQVQFFNSTQESRIIQKAITIDPALNADKKASKSAIMVAGVDKQGNLYVLDYVAKKGLSPSDIINITFSMHKKWKPSRVGVEVVGYQGALVYGFREEMSKQNYYFFIETLKTKNLSKHARIMRLQPLAEQGRLFVRPEHKELLHDLYEYPASKISPYDLLDVLAYQKDLLLSSYSSSDEEEDPGTKGLVGRTAMTLEEIIKRLRGTRKCLYSIQEGDKMTPWAINF